VQPDGRHILFPRTDNGWDRATGATYWLELFGDGFVASDNAGGRWKFTAMGRLEYFERGVGTRVDAMYDIDGRLIGLVHERGRSISLDWENDRVVSVRASDGRSMAFRYDAQGRLTGATGATGRRTYIWGDSSGLIEQVIDADGVIEVLNEYDADGRVASQRSPFGRVSRYSYLPGGVTEVADTDGERSNTWIADATGRLIGVIDSHGNSQSYVWDAHGDLLEVTDRVGQRTVREYDERGRLVHEALPTGADVQYGYDELDRVVTIVVGAADTPDAVTRYEYHGEGRNPSVVIDPVGGRTTMTWARGLLAEIVDPAGVVLRFDYDDRGDLVATTNAVGDTARLERDAAGRVTAAVTPSGHRTGYTYDDTGVLLSRTDADGAVWRFEHTAAGRLTAQVAPDRARTEIEYGPNGEDTLTVDPLGRVIRRVMDDLGNLGSVQLPDGSTWTYVHDALSRLVETVDPAGGVWTNGYDADGAPVESTDPTGVRRAVSIDRADNTVAVDDGLLAATVRLDAFGRRQTVAAADGDSTTMVYDACGRVVEILNADGALTLIRRDLAGRPVQVTDPTGVSTEYVYDACGRLVKEIAADGSTTTREYDADSRLVRQTLPNGDAAWAEYDACGRLTRLHQPGSGTATYTYDRCGRVASAVDTWWGTRRFAYDAAGQLTGVTNGLGAVTRFDYDDNGRLVRITDPLGAETVRAWDGGNRLVSETDPLGRTTTAGYDAAGRQIWQESPAGHRLSFGYDASGWNNSVSADGMLVTSIERDPAGRSQTFVDRTGASSASQTKEWDRGGRLVRHLRTSDDGASSGMSWSYDSAGRRTSMVDAFGRTTTYRYDTVGRLTSVEHPVFGLATMDYDAAGRLVGATTNDPAGIATTQRWEWVDGSIASHTSTGPDGLEHRTLIERDAEGQIVRITRDGLATVYAYDEARQLIEAVTDGVRRSWAFDLGGRVVQRSDGAASETYGYDPAGQLTTVHHGEGDSTTHVYDADGRRTTTIKSDGSGRQFEWTTTGWLTGLTDTSPDGQAQATRLFTDAVGELAVAGDSTLWWDTAAPVPTLAGIGSAALLPLGAVTGIADGWSAPGWRAGRTDTADPWQVSSISGLPGGLGVTATGTLTLGGAGGFGALEWLGARPYDPATQAFLSADPLPPVIGAGWAANPYSYAGNNPLAFSDPTGLHPLSDDDLRKQTQGWLQGAWDATTNWLGDNWEYVAGGAMVVAGGVLMATGVGGPVGAMLIGAGADTIIQKATTGTVNWGEVALSGALGAVGGVGVAARLGLTGVKAVVVAGASSGALSGGVMNGYDYFSGPGPHTVDGALSAVGTGAVEGGVLGAAGGAAGHAIGGRIMGAMTHNPQADTMAMGRAMDARVIPYASEHGYGYYKGTPAFIHNNLPADSHLQSSVDLWVNKKWINYQMMEGNGLRDVGQVPGMPRSDFYEMEKGQVAGWNNGAGYGNYQLDMQP
jgi:YD repeat-containing protein